MEFRSLGLFLWTFPRLRTFLELLFKFQGPIHKIRYCGLIFEKPKGFFAKQKELLISELFSQEKPVDQVHESVDRADPVYHGLSVEGRPKLTGTWPQTVRGRAA
jgi:hypothetical protein